MGGCLLLYQDLRPGYIIPLSSRHFTYQTRCKDNASGHILVTKLQENYVMPRILCGYPFF